MRIEWNTLRAPEFQNITKEDVALVIVGSLEQHALHLPVGTDVFLGNAVAKAAAGKSKRRIFVLPAVNYGFSAHHMDFPGSITLRQKTLVSVLEDIGDGVISTGFSNLVFLISHGGNSASVHLALNELGIRHEGCRIVSFRYWDFMKDFIRELRDSPMGGMGHAGEMETSMMEYLYPALVSEDWLEYPLAEGNQWHHPDMFAPNRITTYQKFSSISPYGNVGVCEDASEEKGRQIVEYVSGELAKFFDGYFEACIKNDSIE